jgi:hypothetical protein
LYFTFNWVQKQRATKSQDALEQLTSQLLEKDAQFEELRSQLEDLQSHMDGQKLIYLNRFLLQLHKSLFYKDFILNIVFYLQFMFEIEIYEIIHYIHATIKSAKKNHKY